MRGKNFTQAEDDIVRLLHAKGRSIREIAVILDRGKSSIHKRIDAMKADGTIGQVLDMGQADDKK